MSNPHHQPKVWGSPVSRGDFLYRITLPEVDAPVFLRMDGKDCQPGLRSTRLQGTHFLTLPYQFVIRWGCATSILAPIRNVGTTPMGMAASEAV